MYRSSPPATNGAIENWRVAKRELEWQRKDNIDWVDALTCLQTGRPSDQAEQAQILEQNLQAAASDSRTAVLPVGSSFRLIAILRSLLLPNLNNVVRDCA
jgi:hypothetical protein